VDGGRRLEGTPPPLIARLDWPGAWSALVILPPVAAGLHGAEEIHAFAKLPPIPDAVTDRLCRLILLGLLPSVAEEELATFGESLTELQRLVGECFAPAQHGIYAHPEIDAIVVELRSLGLHGVGQSSWGPAIYGFSDTPAEERARVLKRVMTRFDLGPSAAFWTQGKNEGAALKALQEEP
jgi:beta-RFAP synthase